MMKRFVVGSIMALLAAVAISRAADTLPAQYTDAEFWRIVNE